MKISEMRDIVMAVVVIALLAALLFSPRYWVAQSRSTISHVADLPKDRELPEFVDMVWLAGVHVAHQRSKAEQAARLNGPVADTRFTLEDEEPRLGYSVREFSMLGMPFAYWTEGGYALYTRSPSETRLMPLNEAGIAELNEAAGEDLTAGFVYPFWKHLWGWLVVAGVALWALLRHMAILRQRAELGMI